MTPAVVLVADPPWRFSDRLPGDGRGAVKHYPCMPVADLMRFPLPPLADDAFLFLWRVAALQQEALDVMRAWGFTLKSEWDWQKTTRTGKPHFGMGRYGRHDHEIVLIGVRGRPKPTKAAASMRTSFAAPVGIHSAKPDLFYERVEAFAGDVPRVELFARRRREGWLTLGNDPALEAPAIAGAA